MIFFSILNIYLQSILLFNDLFISRRFFCNWWRRGMWQNFEKIKNDCNIFLRFCSNNSIITIYVFFFSSVNKPRPMGHDRSSSDRDYKGLKLLLLHRGSSTELRGHICTLESPRIASIQGLCLVLIYQPTYKYWGFLKVPKIIGNSRTLDDKKWFSSPGVKKNVACIEKRILRKQQNVANKMKIVNATITTQDPTKWLRIRRFWWSIESFGYSTTSVSLKMEIRRARSLPWFSNIRKGFTYNCEASWKKKVSSNY